MEDVTLPHAAAVLDLLLVADVPAPVVLATLLVAALRTVVTAVTVPVARLLVKMMTLTVLAVTVLSTETEAVALSPPTVTIVRCAKVFSL